MQKAISIILIPYIICAFSLRIFVIVMDMYLSIFSFPTRVLSRVKIKKLIIFKHIVISYVKTGSIHECNDKKK